MGWSHGAVESVSALAALAYRSSFEKLVASVSSPVPAHPETAPAACAQMSSTSSFPVSARGTPHLTSREILEQCVDGNQLGVVRDDTESVNEESTILARALAGERVVERVVERRRRAVWSQTEGIVRSERPA